MARKPSRAPLDGGLPEPSPGVLVVAAVVVVVLIGFSARYGYHRDELYFLEAGRHLAWGYPDQPPLVPCVARVLSALGPGAVWLLRLPSAVGAGITVVLAGQMAREMDCDRAAQLLAAVATATAGVLIGTDHYLNTSGFDLLAWATVLWLVVRLLRTGDQRLWLAVGLVAGVGLLNSDLMSILIGAIVLAVAAVGPRQTFASPWLWVGGVIAAVFWTPYLVWQAHHGWPELAVSRSIAAGNSATSTPRSLLLPEQFFLVSPFFAPVWLTGLIASLRRGLLSWLRPVGVTYFVVAVAFEVSGGKSYYQASLLPVFLAAGSGPVMRWVRRGEGAGRRRLIVVGTAISAVVTVFFTLPVLTPATLAGTFIPSVNSDLGETVAWTTYVAQIASAWDRLPQAGRHRAAIVTNNYGEAGAVDHFGRPDGLPSAYSRQDGFWYWGPPPDATDVVIAVGFSPTIVERYFTSCRLSLRLQNGFGLKNQEQGQPVWTCGGPRSGWPATWAQLKYLG